MPNFLRSGLHRSLTWRYILVTVVALLAIEAIAILLIARFTPPYTIGMQPDVYLMEKIKGQAVEFLQTNDQEALQRWLMAIEQPVINLTVRDDWLRANLSSFPQPRTQVMMVFHEADGVIASHPAKHPFSDIQRVEDLPGPLSSNLFQSVPERPGPNGVMTREGSRTIAIYPIQGADGTLLALFVLINLATDVPPSLSEVATLALVSILLITAAVGLLVGLFGYLSSRFLVQQVQGLAETTATWGEGDFSQPVAQQANPENELDELALHLDKLRPQMEETLTLRESVAVQGERQRIAQELHDSVKQQIFTLRMNLATAQTLTPNDNEAHNGYINNAISLAESAQQELTALIDVFHRPIADESMAVDRLRQLIDEWSQQCQIPVEHQIDGPLSLSMEVEHGVRRLLQEALANVYKHSGATHVHVALQQESGREHEQLYLSITDDGHGFDVDAVHSGFGLTSMQERVQTMGGINLIESSKTGTKIVVQIPYTEKEGVDT